MSINEKCLKKLSTRQTQNAQKNRKHVTKNESDYMVIQKRSSASSQNSKIDLINYS